MKKDTHEETYHRKRRIQAQSLCQSCMKIVHLIQYCMCQAVSEHTYTFFHGHTFVLGLDHVLDFLEKLFFDVQILAKQMKAPRKSNRTCVVPSYHKIQDNISEIFVRVTLWFILSCFHKARQQIWFFL